MSCAFVPCLPNWKVHWLAPCETGARFCLPIYMKSANSTCSAFFFLVFYFSLLLTNITKFYQRVKLMLLIMCISNLASLFFYFTLSLCDWYMHAMIPKWNAYRNKVEVQLFANCCVTVHYYDYYYYYYDCFLSVVLLPQKTECRKWSEKKEQSRHSTFCSKKDMCAPRKYANVWMYTRTHTTSGSFFLLVQKCFLQTVGAQRSFAGMVVSQGLDKSAVEVMQLSFKKKKVTAKGKKTRFLLILFALFCRVLCMWV